MRYKNFRLDVDKNGPDHVLCQSGCIAFKLGISRTS